MRPSAQPALLSDDLFFFYKQAMVIILLRLLLHLARIQPPRMEIREVAHILQRENESQDFSVPPATAVVCEIPPHFSSLTQLASPFSLTAKMSGRVCFPCCQSSCCDAELVLKSLANWFFYPYHSWGLQVKTPLQPRVQVYFILKNPVWDWLKHYSGEQRG